jgi:hypothetical protein
MKPTEFFQQRFEEEKKQEENLDVINRDVKSYLETKQIIDAIDMTKYRGKDEEAYMAAEVREDFYVALKGAILVYLQSADTEEYAWKTNGSEIDVDAKARLEELGMDRTSTHNTLMDELNYLDFRLKKLNIDNTLNRAIIGTDRKIDKTNPNDRRAVERWARNVADYFATLSETTT